MIPCGESALRQLYDGEWLSSTKIGAIYNVTGKTVLQWMKKYRILAHQRYNAIYSINVDFFKTWTPASAWLYGWAIGDGYYKPGKGLLTFSIQICDEEVLYKFKEALNSEHPVKRTNSTWDGFYIDFWSKEIVKDINKLSYKDIPDEYLSCFVRGFWEAEGGVYWHRDKRLNRGGDIQTDFAQKNKEILEYIHFLLSKEGFGIVNGGHIGKKKRAWYLIFGMNDSISLYHYLYDKCGDFFLKRKKEKFEELISRVSR